MGGLDLQLKNKIKFAVHSGRTTDEEIHSINELYSLIQIGVHVDVNQLTSREADMLIAFHQEVMDKNKREMTRNQLTRRR